VIVKDSRIDLPVGESKIRTPAYAGFDSNTDKILNLFKFKVRGLRNFYDEMKTLVEPQVEALCAQLAESRTEDVRLGIRREACDAIAHEFSEIVLKPLQQLNEGLLILNQWIPVLLVTTVEAYLKDVRIFEAKINPAIMESSEQSVTYAEVVGSRSIEDLAEEMQSRWARNFVDDGGPARWIDKLTRMGARTYDLQTANKMEVLWGVRHVIVHSSGVATPDFVGRHPDFGVTVGKKIVIRNDQLLEWIRVAYHFVDVTDSYFVQRYKSESS
jgi:hypothetical protein